MPDLDIEQLLSPVSADDPAGENLEYDASFSELERAAAGKEERYSGGELIPAEEPDWKSVRQLATELFTRTKDLRVAIQLVRAETAMAGVDGLGAGIGLIRGLLERYWDTVHPKLEAEDEYDPVFRINALASISDPAGLLGLARKAYVVEARSVGRYSFRDLDIVEERSTPVQGETVPTLDLLRAALREAGSDFAQARVDRLQQIRDDLRAIEAVFRANAQGGQTPDVEALDTLIAHGIAFLSSGIARADVQGEATEAAQEAHGSGDTSVAAGGGAAVGALRSRADVKRILDQVCEFLERSEPSNPAPLLIRRAQRLLDLSFIDIIQDLAPEAYGQIEKLAGSLPAAQPAAEQ
ncbi:MAG: type VI secretion system protein TssA [Burkholderiales bacterium]|nr:type VI secretion system protein TssA [Burkholderiales bacterium]